MASASLLLAVCVALCGVVVPTGALVLMSSAAGTAGSSRSLSKTRFLRPLGEVGMLYEVLEVKAPSPGPPTQDIEVSDLTPLLQGLVEESGIRNGVMHVISRHTTTAITINERESRLAKDMKEFFLRLAPPDDRSTRGVEGQGVGYRHNDIHLRPDGQEEAQRCRDNGWDIDDPAALEAWRGQEPINAHSHLISMIVGSSESIPIVNGKMVIGQWQSVLLVDLDGPRDRTVGVQLLGATS